MIAAVLFGIGESGSLHPGRNTYPVLGRPLMAYPLLAARASKAVDVVAVSTNSPLMAQVGENLGCETIIRPPHLAEKNSNMGEVFRHAIETLEAKHNKPVDLLVVLLANAPAVSAELIDHALSLLQNNSTYDSAATVAIHNEHNPSHACFISSSNELVSFLAPPLFRTGPAWSRDALGDIYFINNCVRVLRRPHILQPSASSRLPYPWMGERTSPIMHQGGYDVDYDWQIHGVERWLRQVGFTETATPYDSRPQPVRSLPAAFPPRRTETKRVLITTVPFGEIDPKPLHLLEKENIAFDINPLGRRLRPEELAEIIGPYEALIAGTEQITPEALERAPHLRLIARVGIGLDNVPLLAARQKNIQVTYTPNAPSAAVAELAIAQMLALLRRTVSADHGMRQGVWHRWMGRRLGTCTVGVIGVGRIGRRVIQHLQGWNPIRILANDLIPDDSFAKLTGCIWTDKETIYREADIITLHLPLTANTRNLISSRELGLMKSDAILLNTARGGIINETDLAGALRQNPRFSSAIDVFLQEPYAGELAGLENCLLSCHMGSGTVDCRLRMEQEATEEIVRYFQGQPFANPVPESEYQSSPA
jgi:D-3-phosphoglycerate dehydrogenase